MASTYISRTLGTPTSQLICTFSAWVKRAAMDTAGGGDNYPIFYSSSTAGEEIILYWHSTAGKLSLFCENGAGTNFYFQTSAVYRDPAAWYHVVMTLDNSQAQANRVKLYVNGAEPTLSTSTEWSNTSTLAALESGATMAVGGGNIGGGAVNIYYKGCMSHVHFCDGYAYAASAFGSTDATDGIWKINTGPSVTYGNNGFFLKMEDRTNVDLDSSGNALTMTTAGSLIATYDNPSNNFCNMNIIDNYRNQSTFSNIANQFITGGSQYAFNIGTMGMQAGLWYWEIKIVASTTIALTPGIAAASPLSTSDYVGSQPSSYSYYGENGKSINNSTQTAYGNTYVDDDIIGVYLDLTANKLYFAKNGTVQNSGTGISITAATEFSGGHYYPAAGDYDSVNTGTFAFNFGNGYFGTTAVTSAVADEGGYGAFEYDPSAGTFDGSSKDFRALCTKNLYTYGG